MKQTPLKPSQSKGHPLNVRDFPSDLYWKCKVRATETRMTLKEFVIHALERAVGMPEKG